MKPFCRRIYTRDTHTHIIDFELFLMNQSLIYTIKAKKINDNIQ